MDSWRLLLRLPSQTSLSSKPTTREKLQYISYVPTQLLNTGCYYIMCAFNGNNLQRQVSLCEYLLSAANRYQRKEPKALGIYFGQVDYTKNM